MQVTGMLYLGQYNARLRVVASTFKHGLQLRSSMMLVLVLFTEFGPYQVATVGSW